MTVPEAFYVPDGDDRYVSTELTIGPWSNDSQHAGPPAALLGRSIERANGRDDMQVARVTFEILRPVPVAPLVVEAQVVRPGRSVELVEASLSSDATEVMRARAVRIRRAEVNVPPVLAEPPPRLPEATETPFFPGPDISYLSAMEWRFVKGGFLERGPATAWARMRHPFVGGEEVSALTRVLIAADSGNGISATLDWSRWLFINPDLTVYLHRLPVGEWVCLDARTTTEPVGIGLATSTIHDERGAIGRGLQTLFLQPREEASRQQG